MRSAIGVAALFLTTLCFSPPVSAAAHDEPPDQRSELEVQAVVLKMADDYIGALGEAVHLPDPRIKDDTRARWLLQPFAPGLALRDVLVLIGGLALIRRIPRLTRR